MDETSRGYPYPECDPPLVQDASFISQLQALAEAVDADMTALEARANEELITPPAARVFENVAAAQVGVLVTPSYNDVNFASPGMWNPLDFGIRITSSGWYLLGTFCVVLCATELNARTRFLRNSSPLTQFSDTARLASATAEDPYLSTVALLDEGDLIRTQIAHTAAPATGYTTQSRMWALRVAAV